MCQTTLAKIGHETAAKTYFKYYKAENINK